MLGFAALSFLAYPLFFVFLLSTSLGWLMTSALAIISLGVAGYQLTKQETRRDLLLADVWLPILLLFPYTLSCFLVLILHNGSAANAFNPDLGVDNYIPKMLADHLWYGGETVSHGWFSLLRVDRPTLNLLFGEWHISDRPPLQGCIYLVCLPFVFLGFESNDIYAFAATFCQTIWIPAVYLFARQLHFSRYALGFTLIWFAGNGFLLVNSFFTWPKLLAASLFLTGLSILFFCARKLPNRCPEAVIVLGLIWGLALLAHGGVLFSLLAVPFLPPAWRLMRAEMPAFLLALAVFVLLDVPWSAYQNFYDPPGNRLLKWHMAGVIPIDSRGTWQTLYDSYSDLTFGQWLENRWGNLETSLLWDSPFKYGPIQTVANFQAYLNWEAFFRVTGVLGLLSAGYIVLLIDWLRGKPGVLPADSHWRELLAMSVGSYLIWIALMFLPDGASVHQGSYAMLIILMMIGTLSLASLPKWAALSLLVCQWILFCFIFLFFFRTPQNMSLAWWIAQGSYWILMLLFVLSVRAFLPRDSKD